MSRKIRLGRWFHKSEGNKYWHQNTGTGKNIKISERLLSWKRWVQNLKYQNASHIMPLDICAFRDELHDPYLRNFCIPASKKSMMRRGSTPCALAPKEDVATPPPGDGLLAEWAGVMGRSMHIKKHMMQIIAGVPLYGGIATTLSIVSVHGTLVESCISWVKCRLSHVSHKAIRGNMVKCELECWVL